MAHEPEPPVIVVGAGPVGLAAAAHLADRRLPFLLLEAGDTAGNSVREWGHVQLFSPWQYNVDGAARRLLGAEGWPEPDADELPTGTDLLKRYLLPLAESPVIAPYIRYGTTVEAISRLDVDRMRTVGREKVPFVVRLADGEEVLAQAVIDASGTWRTPNMLGANGLPARGEAAAASRIFNAMPDVLGTERDRFAGRHTVVVGAGHSAATTLLALADLAKAEPETRITWAIRAADPTRAFGGESDDELPARGLLGSGLHMLIDSGRVTLVPNFRTHTVELRDDGVELFSRPGQSLLCDQVVAATGYRPDHSIASELRLDLDPILSAPRPVAPLIDPNDHACGTVRPHGYRELAQPEPGYFIVGMKSYGRAPTFLMATGYEQVRSIVASLAGDLEAAASVELVLPETGVCSAVAGAEALAQRMGISPELHTSLLHATARHLGRSPSAAAAVMAAAAELGVDESVALQLAAYAADRFDVPGTNSC
ncbi:FAD-dependent oxidoreductase [Actinomadura macra]|uniref:FAD-dependent oxidoreductase n=1 Tax=Actinomadura macra TaxID=46164 RepID=UPI000830A7DF|nr:FAD-dependent oxidoreductase [Actinomadura macra]